MAMKQNNFYLRWQKAAGAAKSEQRSRSIRTAAPGIAVVAAALLGWGAMTLYTASLTSQRQDIVNWCNDNSASFLASSQDAEAAAQFRSLTQYADGMTDLLDGYHGRAAVQRQLQSGHRHPDLHSLAAELRRFFDRELYRLQRR